MFVNLKLEKMVQDHVVELQDIQDILALDENYKKNMNLEKNKMNIKGMLLL